MSARQFYDNSWKSQGFATPFLEMLAFAEAYAADLHRQQEKETANLLTNLAQILDVVKREWGEVWSAWDQQQRDGITKFLKEYYNRSAPIEGEGHD